MTGMMVQALPGFVCRFSVLRAWSLHCTLVNIHCSEAAELLILNACYLPQKIVVLFIMAVYTPLSFNANMVLKELHDNIGSLQNKHKVFCPGSLIT